MPQHLFVYGTLRSESSHPFARRLRAETKLVGKASASGVLYDLGHYPGARFEPDAKERVVGDLFALGNADRLLQELDAYEGVRDAEGLLFERIAIKVHLYQGGTVDAWTYALRQAPARPKRVGGGDFVLHQRMRDRRPSRP